MVKANNPSSLKKLGGILELTNRCERDLLYSMEYNKRKGTTGKIEPSPQFLPKEKFTFQRAISTPGLSNTFNALKLSVFGVIRVRIILHTD